MCRRLWSREHCTTQGLHAAAPEVFTIQLAWRTSSASKEDIKGAMQGLRQVRHRVALPDFMVFLLPHIDACNTKLPRPIPCLACAVSCYAAMHSLNVRVECRSRTLQICVKGYSSGNLLQHGVLLCEALCGVHLNA